MAFEGGSGLNGLRHVHPDERRTVDGGTPLAEGAGHLSDNLIPIVRDEWSTI